MRFLVKEKEGICGGGERKASGGQENKSAQGTATRRRGNQVLRLPQALDDAVNNALCGREPVFLDSAGSSPESRGISIVGSDPAEVFAGKSEDIESLRRAYLRLRQTSPNAGALIGTFNYDRSWRFSYYPRVAIFEHGCADWISPPRIDGRHKLSANPVQTCRFREKFRPTISKSEYVAWVRRAQEYIAAGDIYQVNLTHKLEAGYDGNPYDFYRRLRSITRAPYSAYLQQGARIIASASPECFLRIQGREILTCPIKGTRPRGADREKDRRLERELLSSIKERAELLMITDLERNDLGRVCKYGTVCVPELFAVRRHPHLFHMVSTVRGLLRDNVDHVQAVYECLPGGSITGAPKIRAMQIIDEIEAEPRGLYTGALGYFGMDGWSCFSIVIRTMIFEEGQAHFHVGAGIVADSEAEKEYEETLLKARGLELAAEAEA